MHHLVANVIILNTYYLLFKSKNYLHVLRHFSKLYLKSPQSANGPCFEFAIHSFLLRKILGTVVCSLLSYKFDLAFSVYQS